MEVVPNTVTVIRQPAYYCARQNADSPSQNDNDEEEVVKTVQDLIQRSTMPDPPKHVGKQNHF